MAEFSKQKTRFLASSCFFRLGELGSITNAWFSPNFKIFKNLYLTKGMKIGDRNWKWKKLPRQLHGYWQIKLNTTIGIIAKCEKRYGIIKELKGIGRRVNEGSIYTLLERDNSFISIGQGNFRLKENVN